MESRIDLCSKGSLLQMLFGGLMLMVMCLQLYQVHFGAFFFFTRFLGNTSGWVFYILQLSSGAGYRYVLRLCTTGLTTTPAISQHSLWSAVQTLRYGAFLTLKTRDTGDQRVSASILFFQEAMFVCLLHNVHNVYIISEIIVCWWPQWLGARWSQLSASYWSGYPGSAAPPWAAWRAGPLGPQGGCRAELLPLQFQLSREPQKFTQLITGTHQQRFYWDLVLSRMTWSVSRPREPPRENVWGQWSTSCHHDTVVGFISQFVGGLFLTFFVVPLSVEMSREVTDWPDFLYSH